MTPPTERFLALTRNPKLRPPVRWEPTQKAEGDVVISTRRVGS